MIRLDAHQHFWKYSAAEYEWIDESMIVLRRDFLPHDLKPLLDQNGVEAPHGNKPAQRRGSPVIERSHRVCFGAQFYGQSCDQYQGVEMAGVIGIIDPLPRLRRAALPVGMSAGQ